MHMIVVPSFEIGTSEPNICFSSGVGCVGNCSLVYDVRLQTVSLHWAVCFHSTVAFSAVVSVVVWCSLS